MCRSERLLARDGAGSGQGNFVLGFRKPQELDSPFWALLLPRRAARVQMWVWVVAKPCPGCRVPITSVPRLSPAAPLCSWHPKILGSGCCTCQS